MPNDKSKLIEQYVSHKGGKDFIALLTERVARTGNYNVGDVFEKLYAHFHARQSLEGMPLQENVRELELSRMYPHVAVETKEKFRWQCLMPNVWIRSDAFCIVQSDGQWFGVGVAYSGPPEEHPLEVIWQESYADAFRAMREIDSQWWRTPPLAIKQ